jgi:hypothetical protein
MVYDGFSVTTRNLTKVVGFCGKNTSSLPQFWLTVVCGRARCLQIVRTVTAGSFFEVEGRRGWGMIGNMCKGRIGKLG